MKIAIFTDSFFPQINGVVTATINIAKGMADKGHKVIIFAPKFDHVKEFKHKNVKVIRVLGIPALFYEDFKFTSPINTKIEKIIVKEKIDIIHFQVPMTLGLLAIRIAKKYNIPLVGTFHTFFADPGYLKHIGMNNEIVQKLAWKYSYFFYKNCNLVTCPSEYAKKEIYKFTKIKGIKFISNGIDLNQFDNKNSEHVMKKYHKTGKFLLYVGRIAHEKNIDYLLECFNLVCKKEKDVKLMMVGGGPQFDLIKKKSKELGISNRIIMTGKIEHDKLIKSGIFGACEIFVTASLTETQGIVVLEAQANGLVCVGINKKGVAELIEDNHNGFLIRNNYKKGFANAILKLLSDEETYNRLQKGTIEKIKEHDLSNVISTWEKEYERLIKEKIKI